ncbi:MAG: hypothetical protein O8C61_02500 [Candidatus Methanoperedens sp.]|nr:hypothetical protein [Candidatus Methanoperedens sp.]
MTLNPAIACAFEYFNSPKPTLFKNEVSTAPAATAARYPSADGATQADQWVWVKPSARLVVCEYGVPGTRNRFLLLDFRDTNTLTAME